MAAVDLEDGASVYKKLLTVAVCSLCKEEGFHNISPDALQTLSEALQSYVLELSRCSQEYTQLCQRTCPSLADVKLALIDIGSDVDSLFQVISKRKKERQLIVTTKKPVNQVKQLQSSTTKQQRPNYIATHLPTFPDPHSYMHTPKYKNNPSSGANKKGVIRGSEKLNSIHESLRKPISEYETVREKFAEQMKDSEISLTRYLARTNPASIPIFQGMNSLEFPLIACKPSSCDFITALCPSEEDKQSPLNHGIHQILNNSNDESMEETLEDNDTSLITSSADNPYLQAIKTNKKHSAKD